MADSPRALLLVFLFFVAATSRADAIDLLKTYRFLHNNPEISLQEKDTSAFVAAKLENLGYRVHKNIGGYGLVALLKNGAGPTIMFRADMDALPVQEKTGLPFASEAEAKDAQGNTVPVMHACGHDLHLTVMLGLAERLARTRSAWQGTLMLVAQPAEEIGAGARMMLADGLFSRFPTPSQALAYHVSPDLPAGKIGYVSGYAMANVDSVDIVIKGTGGHGAYPHKILDPIVMAAQIVNGLQTIVSRNLSPLDSAVVSVGSIHGGTKHNVIPDEVRLQLTVRSYADETRNLVLRRIRDISNGVAAGAGVAKADWPEVIIKDDYTPSVYNDPELISRIVPVAASVIGAENVVAVSPVMAGEDFAHYSRAQEDIPTVLLWLGAVEPSQYDTANKSGDTLPGLHSAYFAPDAEPAIDTGIAAMEGIIVALFDTGNRR